MKYYSLHVRDYEIYQKIKEIAKEQGESIVQTTENILSKKIYNIKSGVKNAIIILLALIVVCCLCYNRVKENTLKTLMLKYDRVEQNYISNKLKNNALVKENKIYKKVYNVIGIGGIVEEMDNQKYEEDVFVKNYNLLKYKKQFSDYIFPVVNPKESYTWSGGCEFIQRNYYFHRGIDIVSRYDLDVLAVKEGKVIEVYNMKYPGNYRKKSEYLGNYIVIEHPDGKRSLYGHLSVIKVELDQEVIQGERIGYIGDTGQALGMHVHFELYEIKGNKRISYNFVTNSLHHKKVKLSYTKRGTGHI